MSENCTSLRENASQAPKPLPSSATTPEFCLHCGKGCNRSRGLCHTCYADTEIRVKYPILTAKRFYGNRISDANRGVPLEPTQARPGSEEKILVMIKRYEEGSQLFHPEDRRLERESDDVALTDTESVEVEKMRGRSTRVLRKR